LLSGDMSRVVGLEWEAKDIGQGDMELFGHDFPLLPGHPGVPEPHYMFHAYFRPNGQVLFSVFDPELACLTPSTATAPPEGNGAPRWIPVVLGMLAVGAGLLGLSRAFRRKG
jgi:hypothetical protein